MRLYNEASRQMKNGRKVAKLKNDGKKCFKKCLASVKSRSKKVDRFTLHRYRLLIPTWRQGNEGKNVDCHTNAK